MREIVVPIFRELVLRPIWLPPLVQQRKVLEARPDSKAHLLDCFWALLRYHQVHEELAGFPKSVILFVSKTHNLYW